MLSTEHQSYYADMLQSEIDKEEESELINDILDVSDSRSYSLFRMALIRMVQILKK